MTLTMFLLGALFVVFMVTLMAVAGSYGGSGLVIIVGIAGIAMAFWQWWSSDKVAMRAMRAREVSPQEAPELHGMIDRLCAMRSEEHTSELQSLMRISYAVFCLQKKNNRTHA